MARRESVDRKTRETIRAWLLYKMEQNRLNIAATAQLLKKSAAAVSRIASADRTPGLDFVLAMHRNWHIPLDVLVGTMPPKAVQDGVRPIEAGKKSS
jgi:antitoxin component HigA of HigAB toxin-antitoxin module